jgi:alpha-ketoglutarate-dependent taurine dioxygenase
MYVRNHATGVDLPWETVFQTNQREEVERYCRSNDIDFEWKKDGGLRTRQVCQGVATHPRTKDLVWFNQAHLFHVSTLDKKTRAAMLRLFKEEDLPRNSYYGDGSAISDGLIEKIRDAFLRECVAYPWEAGDVMLVDNMLAAHGRSPYSGPRKVLVALAEPFSTLANGGQ